MKISFSLLSALFVTSSLFSASGCIDRNLTLNKMTMKQIASRSDESAEIAEANSTKISTINHEIKQTIPQIESNLSETKKHRKNIR